MALYTEGLPAEDVSAPLRPSPHPYQLPPEIRNQVDLERSRPVVRPTTRQAVRNPTDAVPRSENLPLSLESQDRLTAYAMPMAERLVSQPRLLLSVSPTPRREVRGGFPRQQSLPVG